MKKVLKRSLSLLLAITLVFSSAYVGLSEVDFGNLFTVKASAATFDQINANNVFIKQPLGSVTCTLCSTVNMMRRVSMLRGDANWATITESAVKPVAWTDIGGLKYSFDYSNSAKGIANISVRRGQLSGNASNTSTLINLLARHPEGIVIHNGTHAVLLTDYTNGVFYCNDPDPRQPVGRVTANRAYSVRPENATQYWYVSSPSVSLGNAEPLATPTITFNKSSYTEGDTITVSWTPSPSDSNLSHYWISVRNPDGNLVISQSIDKSKTSYSFKTPGIGTYQVTISATPIGSVSGEGSLTDTKSITINPMDNCLEYVVYDDGIMITNCVHDYEGELIIPAFIDGYPVTSIGENAFSHCYSLTSITIPNSVTSVGYYAFSYCESLTSITIPNSVTSIASSSVFEGCTSLTSITVDSANKNYSSVDGVLFNKAKTKLICYPAGKTSKSYIIPNSVTCIGDYAFCDCTSLTSVTIPDSVISIGCSPFGNTGYSNNSANWKNGVLYIGNHLIAAEYTLSGSYTVEDGTKTIAGSAFSFCYSLTSIIIPDSVTRIGVAAFEFCTSLNSITIPYSVKSIDGDAFLNCRSLKNVFYMGSEAQSKTISIDIGNEDLEDATWHYAKAPKPATPVVATTNEIGGVNIAWNKVDGATKYVVYRRQAGNSTWVNVGTTTGNTFLDKTVKSGIYYVYSVRAYNALGGYSDFVSANTSTRKFMATPKLTTIYNHANGLAIKWNAVAGVTNGYRVYRRGAGSTFWTYLGTTKNLYFIDSAVKNNSGKYYRYTVIADGDYHSKFDTTGLYLMRLANPTLVSATSSKSGITVKWSAVKGTTGYYVYRKTANSTWVRVAAVGGTNNTTYLDKTAKKGTTYTYTVKAVYGSTTSAYNSGISCYDKY